MRLPAVLVPALLVTGVGLGCRAVTARPGSVPESRATAPEPAPGSLPRWVDGDGLLGSGDAALHRAPGALVLEDAWIDPGTGEVVAWVAVRAGGDRGAVRHWLDASSIRWGPATTGEPRPWVEASRRAGPGPGLDVRALADGAETAELAGVVTEVEEHPEGVARGLILKVRDSRNHLHRALVEPGALVRRAAPELEPGARIELSGYLTRDGQGKLWLPTTLRTEQRDLTLRSATGEPMLDDLTAQLLSARRLSDHSLAASEGGEHPITGWVLDRGTGRVSHVRIGTGPSSRRVPWEELQPSRAAGSWPWRPAGEPQGPAEPDAGS